MSILGIDYGAKKIGLAKSDRDGRLAVPLTTLQNSGRTAVLDQLRSIIQTEAIDSVVVGVPLSLRPATGDRAALRDKDLANKQMQEVLAFIGWLKDNLAVPIVTEDERLSTKMARKTEKLLVKENGDDAIAAMLILQTYLDRQNR